MKTSKVVIADRQKRAMQAFCAPGPSQHKVEDAAGEAGTTDAEVRQVFAELCKKPFKESLEVFDVNKPFLASQCRELLKHPKCKPADKITLMKLLLKTMGEATEDAQTVNVNTPKALVIVGGNQKKLNAMLNPKRLTEALDGTP